MASKKANKPKGIIDDIKSGAAKALSNNPIIGQNIKYLKAAQEGPKAVVKTAAVDAAWAATGAAIGQAGSKLGSVIGKAAGAELGERVGSSYLDDALRAIDKSSQGGRVFKTNTPMGPTLGSTKIMTPGQLESAKKGLSTIASNQASRVASNVAGEVQNLVSGAIRATSRGVGAIVAGAGVANNKVTGTSSSSNSGQSMISSIKNTPPYNPGVVGKKAGPTLKQIAQEKNTKIPLGPNKPATKKKTTTKSKPAVGGNSKKNKPAF